MTTWATQEQADDDQAEAADHARAARLAQEAQST